MGNFRKKPLIHYLSHPFLENERSVLSVSVLMLPSESRSINKLRGGNTMADLKGRS